jgi:hypothetical protein
MFIITRVKFNNGEIRTIGFLQKINKSSEKDLAEYLIDRLGVSKDAYLTTPIISVIFSYGIREGKIIPKINVPIKPTLDDSFSHTYYKNKLPIGVKPEDFGTVLIRLDNKFTISLSRNIIIYLQSSLDEFGNTINLITYIKNGRILFTWKDIINGNKLTREIGKSIYFYELRESGWELNLTRIIKPSRSISNIKVNKNLDTRIIIMDLETIIHNESSNINEGGIHIPYLLSWTDGIKTNSYFISSLDNERLDQSILDMISRAMDDICIRKYKGYRIYFHNFSRFDSFFLLKHLAKLGDCQPIIHKGKIITLNFTSFKSKYSISFKDTYLLLPSSLRALCKSFNLSSSDSKGIFPYLLSDINYSGEVPDFKYFSGITLEDYNKYKAEFINKTWNFRIEAKKYCELDCLSLYQVLTKFNSMIFEKTSLNINRFPTLPSLSLTIFRTHYLIKDQIMGLAGEVSDRIRDGYTGGSVDMFIPLGEMIWGYDVNALYPYVMANFDMPIGNPTFFKGNIRKYDPNAFGFFRCKITSPKSLKHPILQTHKKTNAGTRTISPLGTWEDIIFSEEMDNAIKYGYKFEILWGYTFMRGKIFNSFINDFYKLRLEYPKTDPMNYIAKIILNSLYGRFGMNDSFIHSEIVNNQDYNNFEVAIGAKNIIESTELGDNLLVQWRKPDEDQGLDLDTHNVNVAISAAITAYARIHMSQFKNNPLFNLYYTDTDSYYFDSPLPDSFVSSTELGKLKLEGIYTKALFLGPKFYALRTQEGKEIIKIKGLTSDAISKYNISIDLLSNLLMKNSKLEFRQTKWFKDLTEGTINIKDVIYSLKVTENKRELIYDNNKLSYTIPYSIDKNKLIT